MPDTPPITDPREANDKQSMVMLIILYFVQGIPMGFSSVMPTLLQERHATLKELAHYSIASLPFSFKILWSPIVDALFHGGVGRRRSWVIPTQLVMSVMLYYLATSCSSLLPREFPSCKVDIHRIDQEVHFTIANAHEPILNASNTKLEIIVHGAYKLDFDGEDWSCRKESAIIICDIHQKLLKGQSSLIRMKNIVHYTIESTLTVEDSFFSTKSMPDEEETSNIDYHLNINLLTGLFFSFFFICATQDIAVDGWALTILSPKSVKHAGACNSIGQTLGWMLPNFLLFVIPGWIGMTFEMGNVCFWFATFVLVTTVILIVFQKEESHEGETEMNLKQTYMYILETLRSGTFWFFFLSCLTSHLARIPEDKLFMLRLIKKGFPRSVSSSISSQCYLINMFIIPFLSKYLDLNRPMVTLRRVIVIRACVVATLSFFIQWNISSYVEVHSSESLPYSLICIVYLREFLMTLINSAIFISAVTYINSIANKNVGGTSVTIFTSALNISYHISGYVCLHTADFVAKRMKLLRWRVGDTEIDEYFILVTFSICFAFLLPALQSGIERRIFQEESSIKQD